jgi:hypothetical protein
MSALTHGVRLAMCCLVAWGWVSAAAAQPKQTASEFYMAYRAAMEKAKAIEEIAPMMSKDVRAQIEATPAEQRKDMFEFVKEMSGSMKVKVVKETKTAEGVTLTVEGTSDGEKSTGQVQIVQEGGAWKMSKESWSSKS